MKFSLSSTCFDTRPQTVLIKTVYRVYKYNNRNNLQHKSAIKFIYESNTIALKGYCDCIMFIRRSRYSASYRRVLVFFSTEANDLLKALSYQYVIRQSIVLFFTFPRTRDILICFFFFLNKVCLF